MPININLGDTVGTLLGLAVISKTIDIVKQPTRIEGSSRKMELVEGLF